MLATISMDRAHQAIVLREDFQVQGNAYLRDKYGYRWALRGYDPYACFGFHGPAAMHRGRMDQKAWRRLQQDMEHGRAAYAVESFGTVIAWQTSSGDWRLLPSHDDLTTIRHQGLVMDAISHGRPLSIRTA